MNSSPGAATIISLALVIVLSACPATGALSFPAGRTVAADLVAGVPGLQDNGAPSTVKVIDESFFGKTVRVARDDTLLVQLHERNPDQIWHFDGGGNFKVVSDRILEMYPSRHDFRVKVLGPGELRFVKIDRRDGFAIDRFTVNIVIKDSKRDKDPLNSYPLWGLHAIRPQMDAFRPWWQ